MRKALVISALLILTACTPSSPEPTSPANTETASLASTTATKTPRPTATRAATLTLTPTNESFELEILAAEVYEDRFGNTRATVTVRNPYSFDLQAQFRPRVTIYDAQGNVLTSQELLEDGVYGTLVFGAGEQHTLHGCFDPCDGGVPVGDWTSYEFIFILERVE